MLIAPAIGPDGEAATAFRGKLRMVAIVGAEFVFTEGKAAATAASKTSTPDPNDQSITQYDLIKENMGVSLGHCERLSPTSFKEFSTGHNQGVLTMKVLDLRKIRPAQSSSADFTPGDSEKIGNLTITHRADNDHKITNTSEFLIAHHIWMWGHLAAGSVLVAPPASRPNAGTKGPEGDSPDGRVYVTLGSMIQYQVFLYKLISHGYETCLRVHLNVMRSVAELVLQNDMNFASALASVMSMNTPEMFLHQGYGATAPAGSAASSALAAWTPPRKGAGKASASGGPVDLATELSDLQAEVKRLRSGRDSRPRNGKNGGGGNGGGGSGGGGAHGGGGGAHGGGGGGGGSWNRGGEDRRGGDHRRDGPDQRRRSRSRDRDERRN